MSILSTLKTNEKTKHYLTDGQILVTRKIETVSPTKIDSDILPQIDAVKGAVFSSSFEFTGRYSRWDVAFLRPPLEISFSNNRYSINALNERGKFLLELVRTHFLNSRFDFIRGFDDQQTSLHGTIPATSAIQNEEDRTKQPSIFQIIRELKQLFASDEDQFFGLYGAFGFDLIYQFEQLAKEKKRPDDQKDLVLYLPDELTIVDHHLSIAYTLSYDVQVNNESTNHLERTGQCIPYERGTISRETPYKKGYYADLVKKAIPSFHAGDLFEVVPTQVLEKSLVLTPSEVFQQLRDINPSPYGFIINLGEEYLVGASPEMFVRVQGQQVETCPISGTIRRGKDPLEDAQNIKKLLNSKKDETELTMCTDVDRNDKARICLPGSIEVIGRRQVETYARLFHTVDHIIGEMRDEYDALDAFMTHMWAVTVTGAPKIEALRWIEKNEETPRGWYGGAVGWFAFNGDLNTGLTLRTTAIKNNTATLRVGATLLHTSDPEDEEEETLVKVSALAEAVSPQSHEPRTPHVFQQSGKGKSVLIIDHEDSFVHTLGSYFKQTGATVSTTRSVHARDFLNRDSYDLVVLSPGPGTPKRFGLSDTISLCVEKDIPIFGVCLGFQGIVEHFKGELGLLDTPCHGEQSDVFVQHGDGLFRNVAKQISVGRYHSIYAKTLPDCLRLEATTADHIPMAVQHKHLPIAGVQFHPESILSKSGEVGLQLIQNVMAKLCV
ncbi:MULTISPECIES: anthranilate synthase component I [Shouchella]|uniref:Anthranilate synthase n=1 Tax=Shouchella hunanensis TaxID=766894 RepID=A0ABY7WA90_9BACI|nr:MULTISPECIES: anthranilate synthase component I [Shouchella]WDF04765.1 anthranilate synthase component I [Shouchella hunanensis]